MFQSTHPPLPSPNKTFNPLQILLIQGTCVVEAVSNLGEQAMDVIFLQHLQRLKGRDRWGSLHPAIRSTELPVGVADGRDRWRRQHPSGVAPSRVWHDHVVGDT